MLAYVFPGQGSQSKGMGEGLFHEFPELTEAADKILGYSIEQICLEDKDNLLGNTEYTQPALYVVNALSYYKKLRNGSAKPNFTAGHSLGEYNALLAAGAFSFETGLKMVKKRAELMSKARNGGMAAVIGVEVEKIQDILTDNQLVNIDIANYNTALQTVLSGPAQDISTIKSYFEKVPGALVMELNVRGAFHSRYMREASVEFEGFLDEITFSNLQIPVIANINALPYKDYEIKNNLVRQITGSVQWNNTIIYLMQYDGICIEQVGPGNVLTGMIKRISKELAVESSSKKSMTNLYH